MRTILITGASGGLAQEMVKLLPKDQLILLGRDATKLQALYAWHPQAHCYQVDITDAQALEDLVAQLIDRHGLPDILVNNAGYGHFVPFEANRPEQIQAMFTVNTFALMQLCQLIGQQMKARGRGQIINILSMAGKTATKNSSLYNATKFAAMGFSNALRLELADHNVQVLTVNPGPIATSFFDEADPDGSYQESVKAFLLQPDVVAKRIVQAMGTKKRELNLPWVLGAAYKFSVLFPGLADWLSRKFFSYK